MVSAIVVVLKSRDVLAYKIKSFVSHRMPNNPEPRHENINNVPVRYEKA